MIIQQMAEMIGRQCGPIQSNLRADGVKVLRLMSADMSQLSRIKCIRKVECVSRGLQVSNHFLFSSHKQLGFLITNCDCKFVFILLLHHRF